VTVSLKNLLLLLILSASAPAALADNPRVRVETSAGSFIVQLDAERAPLTVANFLRYVNDGFYEGTIFHRVVNGFVIQGGGFDADMKLKPPRAPVVNEAGNGLSNHRGTLAMARTAEPHSADAQFYINLADNLALDPKPTRWGYAVFGRVIEGLEVVDEIGHRATTTRNSMPDVPAEPVVIRKVAVLTAGTP
jgi:cyclophilin family peptidyl-prolyl cis-trans isomerase